MVTYAVALAIVQSSTQPKRLARRKAVASPQQTAAADAAWRMATVKGGVDAP